ncbi:hypothetical protein ACOMHN_055130 [Nucella lapillus]
MKRAWGLSLMLVLTLIRGALCASPRESAAENNDFAEFEELDEEEGGESKRLKEPEVGTVQGGETASQTGEQALGREEEEDEDDAIIESEDDELEHLQDEEEFENFDRDKGASIKGKGGERLPDLRMAKVPLHLRTNWDSFYLEMLMVAGLGLYLLNFLAGKTKNHRLATAWLAAHRELLEAHFAIVAWLAAHRELLEAHFAIVGECVCVTAWLAAHRELLEAHFAIVGECVCVTAWLAAHRELLEAHFAIVAWLAAHRELLEAHFAIVGECVCVTAWLAAHRELLEAHFAIVGECVCVTAWLAAHRELLEAHFAIVGECVCVTAWLAAHRELLEAHFAIVAWLAAHRELLEAHFAIVGECVCVTAWLAAHRELLEAHFAIVGECVCVTAWLAAHRELLEAHFAIVGECVCVTAWLAAHRELLEAHFAIVAWLAAHRELLEAHFAIVGECVCVTAWLAAHRELLEAHFAIVGDDGTGKEPAQGVLMKESESVYALWCSGRSCVEGMLVELKLLKRQDLVNALLRLAKPASDQIVVHVSMEEKKMDKFVLCVAQKKAATRLHKDMHDLSQFTDKKSVDKYDLPASYQLLSECGEATSAFLDKKVCQVLSRFEDVVDYIHVSDQFSGPKSQDDSQPTKPPEIKPVIIFCFLVGGKGQCRPADMEDLRPLMQLVFYCVEKVARFQLSKEGRQRAEKKRARVEEQVLKAGHGQRQEAAQQRREEKARADKERLMNEEDPDRARKLEVSIL